MVPTDRIVDIHPGDTNPFVTLADKVQSRIKLGIPQLVRDSLS